jgi:hypothetical protein
LRRARRSTAFAPRDQRYTASTFSSAGARFVQYRTPTDKRGETGAVSLEASHAPAGINSLYESDHSSTGVVDKGARSCSHGSVSRRRFLISLPERPQAGGY